MATAQPKITLSRSQDIPFNKLVLSQANVRRIKAGLSIEDLAEDIARRTLLQSINVRPVLDAKGEETGMYEIPAGGRRYRALELLVKQKRMAKTQPVPCVVRTAGTAEEDSLAENVQRVALHPLDQFRAFQTLREQGLGEDEIAARFFVSPTVVKQRLKLASVSPRLLDLYADDEMTLEQLMAFTITSDHARQERVWKAVANSYSNEPYAIRRQLTEGAVRASDKRALFVGVEAYEAAGGAVSRDLFQEDDGGYLQQPAILDRLVSEKLTLAAQELQGEGWKWIEAAADFPYGHTCGLRELSGEMPPLSDPEQAQYDALRAEFDHLQEKYEQADEFPDEVDQRLGEIEAAVDAFDRRPAIYDPAAKAYAGVFISIDGDGSLCVERGYVRPRDEPAPRGESSEGTDDRLTDVSARATMISVGGRPSPDEPQVADEEDGIKPLPDRLVTELTADRTLALRDALANAPDTALVAVLHALCLGAFYHQPSLSCLEITAKSTGFAIQSPGLNERLPAKAIAKRQDRWSKQLPEDPTGLWDALTAMKPEDRTALFAHCASLSVNALHEPWNRNVGRMTHADQIARAVDLDMAATGWTPTVENYLGRITKARILEAVREAKGEASAQLIDHLKKLDMAKEADRLLAGTGWLPEPLRTPSHQTDLEGAVSTEAENLPDFLLEQDGDAIGADQSCTLAAE